MKRIYLSTVIFCMANIVTSLQAQETINLYNDKVPNSIAVATYVETSETTPEGRIFLSHVSQPTLTMYKPAKGMANGTSVIICPGGGYQKLAITHEGSDIAKRFTDYGVTAFVLKYRLPNDSIMENKTIAPLQDAQRAIQLVRQHSVEWGLDSLKIGILGASAGGHLAATAATLYNHVVIDNPTGTSLRPDFTVLMYPAISFGALAHTSSAKNLLGNDTSKSRTDLYSCEKQVTANTPPCFLLHATNDKVVTPQHSILFYQALLAKNVPAEMHLYQGGGHGFGLQNLTTTEDWFDSLIKWMKAGGIIKR